MKKLVSVLLAAVMLFSLAASAFAAADKKIFRYVSLGASNASGYGLHGFVPEELYENPQALYRKGDSDDDPEIAIAVAKDGYFTSGYYFYSDRCYPALIQAELQKKLGDEYEVVLNQCAQNSMRADDLRYLIDDAYAADAYNAWRLGNGEKGSGWMYDIERERDMTVNGRRFQKGKTDLRAEYKEALTTADLITYDLGINNFGVYLMFRIIGGMENPEYSADFGDILGEENTKTFYTIRETLRNAIIAVVPNAQSVMDTIEFYADTLTYAYMGYIVNFDATMKFIYDNNPNADVVVVSIQNMMAGLKVDLGGVTLPLGDIFGTAIDLANTYTAILSPYHKDYTYADVRENGHVEYFCDMIRRYDGNPAHIDQDILDCFDAYEGDLQLQCTIREMTEDCPEAYDAAYKAASHAFARLFQKGAEIDTLQMADGLNLDEGATSERIIAIALGAAEKMIADTKSGSADLDAMLSEIDGQVEAMLQTESDQNAACIYTLMLYAQCFFVHPTENGCAELKEKILEAYYGNITGEHVVGKEVVTIPGKIVESITRLVNDLFEKISIANILSRLLSVLKSIFSF